MLQTTWSTNEVMGDSCYHFDIWRWERVVDKLPDENCSHQSGGWDGLAHAECPISDPIVCKLMMLPELSKAVTFTLLAIKASYYLSLCFRIQPDEGPPLQGRCKWFLLESFIWLHSVLKPVWHKVIFISTQDLYFWWPENLPSWVVVC
jgi:hypothetical protein